MNERPLLGSEKHGLNGRVWVFSEVSASSGSRPLTPLQIVIRSSYKKKSMEPSWLE